MFFVGFPLLINPTKLIITWNQVLPKVICWVRKQEVLGLVHRKEWGSGFNTRQWGERCVTPQTTAAKETKKMTALLTTLSQSD